MDIQITEIERLLELLEKAIDTCDRGLLKVEEAQNVIKQVDQKLEELLPHDSIAYRIFDRSKKQDHGYRSRLRFSEYATSGECENITKKIQTIQSILNEYEPEFLRRERGEKNQYFVSAGDVYRSKALIVKIMKRSQRNLSVVDQYLDEEVFVCEVKVRSFAFRRRCLSEMTAPEGATTSVMEKIYKFPFCVGTVQRQRCHPLSPARSDNLLF